LSRTNPDDPPTTLSRPNEASGPPEADNGEGTRAREIGLAYRLVAGGILVLEVMPVLFCALGGGREEEDRQGNVRL